MPKPFDATTRHLFDRGPADWLAVAGLPPLPPGGAATVVDADLSVASASPDKLIRVDGGVAGSLIVHVELQANADPHFDRRMMMYNAIAR